MNKLQNIQLNPKTIKKLVKELEASAIKVCTSKYGGVFSGQLKQNLYCLVIVISAKYGGKKGEAFKPKNTIPGVKHGGGNIML